MTTTTENGRRRPSLSEQIDRLDSILDGLANALNEAVATAVKEAVGVAVKEAVQVVLAEVLANADVLGRLRNVSTAVAPDSHEEIRPNALKRFLGRARRLASRCWQACASVPRRVGNLLTAGWVRLGALRQFRVPILTAIGVGAVVGAGAYFAGPYVAAVAGWVAGFTATLFVHAALWLRRTADGVFGLGHFAPVVFAEETRLG
jgi:hypothetical protein